MNLSVQRSALGGAVPVPVVLPDAEQAVAYDPSRGGKRPLAVHLSGELVARYRGDSLLALAPWAVGRTWSLRSEAPRTERWGLRADGMPMPCEDDTEEAPEGAALVAAPGSAVAVLCVDGPLAEREEDTWCGYVQGYDGLAARLRAAVDDPAVAALVFRVNSPGGDVAGLDECVRMMRADIDRTGKPVLVQIDELGASAACYIAAGVATGGIFLPKSARIGCIGTICGLFSEARALDAAGIDVELICDPPGKSAGWPQLPISDLARERTTALVRASSAEFIEIVARSRGLSVAAVRAFDGKMLRGEEAVRGGLADAVQGLDATIARAAAMGRQARAGAPAMQPAAKTTAGAAPRAAAPSRTTAADSRGRKTMDQAVLCALLGIATTATAEQIDERLRGLTAFEREAVALSGESEPRRALGALRASVETAKRAKDIEAKATAARIDSVIAGALGSNPPKITPAEVDDLRAYGVALGADALDGYLAKRAPSQPKLQQEPKAEAKDAPPANAEPEKHDGKTYAELSYSARAELQKTDRAKWARMKSAHDARKG